MSQSLSILFPQNRPILQILENAPITYFPSQKMGEEHNKKLNC